MHEAQSMDRKEAMNAAASDRGVSKRDIYATLEKEKSIKYKALMRLKIISTFFF